jgi:hypothetical protein
VIFYAFASGERYKFNGGREDFAVVTRPRDFLGDKSSTRSDV